MSPGFTRIDNDGIIARLPEIPSAAVKVFLCLARRTDGAGWCYPSIRTIETDTGLAPKTTCEAIKALVGLGLVVISDGPGGRGAHGYTLPLMVTASESETVSTSESETQLFQKVKSTASESETRPLQKVKHNNTQRRRPKEQHPRNKTQGGKAAVVVMIPEVLNVPEFREAWGEWIQHRAELRKPATPTAQRLALRGLAQMGAARAVAAISRSVGNGWEGIFEQNGASSNGKQREMPRGPGQRHPEDLHKPEGVF